MFLRARAALSWGGRSSTREALILYGRAQIMHPPPRLARRPRQRIDRGITLPSARRPLVPGLIDGVRYFLPDTLLPPAGEELRPMSRPRITQPWAPRGPTLRSLVKLAVACDPAEEIGKRLKRAHPNRR